MRRICALSRALGRLSGAGCCSSSDESDESSNEARTGSMIARLAARTSCCAEDRALCCFIDGWDRAWWTARKSAVKVRRGVGSLGGKLMAKVKEGKDTKKHTLAFE